MNDVENKDENHLRYVELECHQLRAERDQLHAVLLTILDAVDFTNGACQPNAQVSEVLPTAVIELARKALAK